MALTKDIRLIAALTAIGLATGGGAGARVMATEPPEVPVITRSVTSASPDEVTVQFLGDTAIVDKGLVARVAYGEDYPLGAVRPILDGDVVIANLETAVTDDRSLLSPAKTVSFAMRPYDLPLLADAGIDVVALHNNHSMDAGAEGLRQTREHVESAGLGWFGVGDTLAEAERPLILDTAQGRIAIVGLTESFGAHTRASDTTPGMVSFSEPRIQRAYDLARTAGADRVIALVHWGDNYQPVNELQEHWAQVFARVGYDAVIGAGSHTAQRLDRVGATPVLYGLGNGVFGAGGRFDEFGLHGFGVAATLVVTRDEPLRLRVRCLVTDNEIVKFRPRPCTPAQARHFLPTRFPGAQVNEAGVAEIALG